MVGYATTRIAGVIAALEYRLHKRGIISERVVWQGRPAAAFDHGTRGRMSFSPRHSCHLLLLVHQQQLRRTGSEPHKCSSSALACPSAASTTSSRLRLRRFRSRAGHGPDAFQECYDTPLYGRATSRPHRQALWSLFPGYCHPRYRHQGSSVYYRDHPRPDPCLPPRCEPQGGGQSSIHPMASDRIGVKQGKGSIWQDRSDEQWELERH